MVKPSIWDDPQSFTRMVQLIRVDGLTIAAAAAVLSVEFAPITRGAVAAKMAANGIKAANPAGRNNTVTRKRTTSGSTISKSNEPIDKSIVPVKPSVISNLLSTVQRSSVNRRHNYYVSLTRKVIECHAVDNVEEQIDALFGPRVPTSIREERQNTCSWVYGDPLEPDAAYCGRKVDKTVNAASTYCGYHTVLSLSSYWKVVAKVIKTSDPTVTGYSNIAFRTLDRDDRAMAKETTYV